LKAGVFAAIAAALLVSGCSQGNAAVSSAIASAAQSSAAHEAVQEMTVDEVDQRLAKNDSTFHVYDSNEKKIFDKNHVPGAKWVPFDKVTADMLPTDKSDTLVFYCANEH
jgi:hypothetical protein